MRLTGLLAGALLALPVSRALAQGIPVTFDTGRIAETSAWATKLERTKQRYRRVLRDLPGKPSEGILRMFVDGRDLRIVEATYPAAQGRTTKHYYVEDDKPRLIVVRESVYDRPGSERVIDHRTEYLWFEGETVLYWIDADGRALRGDEAEASARGETVLRDFRTTMSSPAAQYRE